MEKAKIIDSGISQAYVGSLSINIFLTAGSNNQAIEDVLKATNRANDRDSIILLKCSLIYSL